MVPRQRRLRNHDLPSLVHCAGTPNELHDRLLIVQRATEEVVEGVTLKSHYARDLTGATRRIAHQSRCRCSRVLLPTPDKRWVFPFTKLDRPRVNRELAWRGGQVEPVLARRADSHP